MKTSTLIAAVTLTAFAGLAQAADKTAKDETLTEKTKHALHVMGEKIRNAGHRMANATHKDDDKTAGTKTAAKRADSRNDTRAMGAPSDARK